MERNKVGSDCDDSKGALLKIVVSSASSPRETLTGLTDTQEAGSGLSHTHSHTLAALGSMGTSGHPHMVIGVINVRGQRTASRWCLLRSRLLFLCCPAWSSVACGGHGAVSGYGGDGVILGGQRLEGTGRRAAMCI